MLTRAEKLKRFLDYLGISNHEFAELIEVNDEEADKLLNGIPVEYDTAHNFIYWIKGYVAQHYIDWESMGIRNPLRYADSVRESEECEEGANDEFDSTIKLNPDFEESDLYEDEEYAEDEENG